MPTGRNPKRSRWRPFDLGLRVMVPIGFAVLTFVNVVSLTHEGTARKPASAPAFPAAAKEVKLATVGEIGSSQSAQQTLRQMADQRPDLYLALGDLGYSGVGSERRWCTLVRDQIGFVTPFELVAGESEEDGSHDGRLNGYAACLPDRMNGVGQYGRQYYIDMGNLARVIMISPNLTVDGTTYSYGGSSPEYAWLGDAIDSARSGGFEWVIVAMNEDCISAGVYYCNLNQDLLSMLVGKRVDLVLSAHDHSYQRSQQIASGTPGCPTVLIDSFNPRCVADDVPNASFHRGAGTIFTVVGSATNDLYPVSRTQPDTRYLAATMGKNKQPSPGSLLLTLSRSSLGGKFVVTNRGSFVDQFTISASLAPPTDRGNGTVTAGGQAQVPR
jgi:hypothetical protein